jgi:predicted SAM-dependent methyltransferase
MPDPHSTLKKIRELLAPGGICLIRIPTVSSYVWEKYQTHWVSMDPPRHFYLHSIKSIKFLAALHDFEVTDITRKNDQNKTTVNDLSLKSKAELQLTNNKLQDI